MVRAFKKRQGKRLASKLESTTLRGFGGGWNTVDEDLSMPPKYQVSLVNFHRTSSGSQAVRWGSTFNVDIKAVRNSPIVDGYYFNGRNVVVTESGNVLTITQNGTISEIWNTAKAAALPGAPAAWPTGVKFVSFVPFKNTLVIHNGRDKPLVVAAAFTVKYLQDEATGSNVHVPIGRYGCVASNFHCIAGLPLSPTEIFISSEGTSGVFVGDPDSNATSIDVGAYAPEGAASIRGIGGFRTFLLVFLQNITLQIKLGEFDDTTHKHTPKFPDTLPQFGLLGHRTIVTVENDLMFCGLSGLASAKRNLYSPEAITSDYLSTIVSSAYRRLTGALTDDQQLDDAFSIFDRLNNDFCLFLPGGRVLVYTFNVRLKMNAWSSFEGMDYRCAWITILGRAYLAKGTKIFLSGNNTFAGENYYADRLMDRDYTYAPSYPSFVANDLVYDAPLNEVWKCTVTHPGTAVTLFEQERENNPDKWVQYEGKLIQMELELPWIDGKDPSKLKQLRYISIATKGDAEFTFDVYVDNLYKDVNGSVIPGLLPSASMTFIGNDAWGYGYDDDPYGMGRRSRDARLFGMPVKFKSVKFRIWGSVNKKLEFVNLTFLFARGKFTR